MYLEAEEKETAGRALEAAERASEVANRNTKVSGRALEAADGALGERNGNGGEDNEETEGTPSGRINIRGLTKLNIHNRSFI